MQLPAPKPPKLADTPVVAMLNLKGGVGKTTLTANLFRLIFRQERVRTLLIDMDPQFNLTQMLLSPELYLNLKINTSTVLSTMEPVPTTDLLAIKTSTDAPPDPATLTHVLRHLKSDRNITLGLIPGDFDLIKYSLAGDSNKLRQVEARFGRFIELCKLHNDVIVFDCNPSSSFLTQCALNACTDVVIPVREDGYSMLGLNLLRRFIGRLGKSPKIHVIINGVPRNQSPSEIEGDIRADTFFGPLTLANRVYYSNYLRSKAGFSGDALSRKGPYHATLVSELRLVSDELTRELGIRNV